MNIFILLAIGFILHIVCALICHLMESNQSGDQPANSRLVDKPQSQAENPIGSLSSVSTAEPILLGTIVVVVLIGVSFMFRNSLIEGLHHIKEKTLQVIYVTK